MATLVMTTGTPQLDLSAAGAWIDILHGNSPGLIHICAAGDWAGEAFDWHKQRQEALDYVARRHDREGIYLRATTLSKPPEQDKRGSLNDALALPGLWADIDLAGPGHKHQVCSPECDTPHTHKPFPLPATVEDAVKIVHAAGLPKPSVWIHSGGGLYPYWVFSEPVMLDDPEVRSTWVMASQRWQEAIGAAATELGFAYGTGVGDLTRVLRLPGTINRKEGLARPCHVLRADGSQHLSEDILQTAVQFARHQVSAPQLPRQAPGSDGDRAGDLVDRALGWDEILRPAGWEHSHTQGVTDYWIRPGKMTRGHSASSGRAADRDRLYVFSEEAGLPTWQPLTKFFVYTALYHRGDFKAAAREIHERYGPAKPERTSTPSPQIREYTPVPGATMSQDPVAPVAPAPRVTDYRRSSLGNAQRMVDLWAQDFRYVPSTKEWVAWAGDRWTVDLGEGHVTKAVSDMTFHIENEAQQLLAADPKDPEGKALDKWFLSSQMDNGVKGTISQFSRRQEVIAAPEDFDRAVGFLNLPNGTYDLDNHQLLPHDRKYMATQMFGTAYDPNAQAPKFRKMIETLLPDPALRSFLQRAVGYSLLGKPNQRAMFILHGPARTGKSQFLNIMSNLFGDYADTAMAGTFHKVDQRGDAAAPGLHALRNKRFVATSEESEHAVLDTESLKRLTGSEAINTRALYQKGQRWKPQMVLWIATNPLPQLNSDDNAIWDRVKPIPFNTRFSAKGDPGTIKETPGISEEIWETEAPGILNWALEGLRMFQECGGLDQPDEIVEQVADYRHETDPVSQFWTEMKDLGQTKPEPEEHIEFKILYASYVEWCHSTNMGRPLAARRFGSRIRAITGIGEFTKANGKVRVPGYQWNPVAGVLGTFQY